MTKLVGVKSFGTAPVFLTGISTILGAVMFLRFGYAVGSVGFLGTMAIILIGHMITIPTAMAIAEIATNQKVEGGGEYFIISRSFGINIGAAIGMALYFSQAISVAFYVVAFAEAFDPVIDYVGDAYGIFINNKRWISIPCLLLLSILITTKGADLGVKALYVVVAVLFFSLLLFFLGHTDYQSSQLGFDLMAKIDKPDRFFYVFAICFPAFTGMTAGVGLSGDLKDPKKSIPRGTLLATISGMIVYTFIAFKMAISSSPNDLVSDQLIMSKIAVWGPIIPIGLACATLSSALGSIMVAPRTLQALANDSIFPSRPLNRFLSKGNHRGEPLMATIVSIVIALFFTILGDVNIVAQIISMFFMVTYGAICTISFFQHFAADPSYRPSFRSKWYISLLGALLCLFLMFKMNPGYATASLIIMASIYFSITKYNANKQGMAKIFQGVIFQLSRQLQVFLQKTEKEDFDHWRPSVICISENSFRRTAAFDLMRWISHKYGFGTYLHYINGYVSKETHNTAKEHLSRLISLGEVSHSNVFIDTIISPSYTTAIAQSIQLPGVSGKENNMFVFEYSAEKGGCPADILDNTNLIRSAEFDIGILASTERGFGYRREIHIWISHTDFDNANLMILLGYVIVGHPDWKNAEIRIFTILPQDEITEQRAYLLMLIKEGRLPISAHNIQLIASSDASSNKEIINKNSNNADLVIIGFITEAIKQLGSVIFEDYDSLGNRLFISSNKEKEIT